MSKDLRVYCILRAFLSSLLLFSVSCAQEGTFSVRFRWNVQPPPPDEYTVEAVVKAPDGRISPSSPASVVYGTDGANLQFNTVPFGDGLVVEIRFRPIRGAKLLRYFGRSSPFSFSSGDSIEVPVALNLVDAPNTKAVRVKNNIEERVSTPLLELAVEAQGVTELQVAQDFDFIAGLRTYSNLSVASSLNGFDTYDIRYDLNESRPICDPAQGGDPSICDGNRRLFVRAVRVVAENERLFSSTASTTITLDQTPPTDISRDIQYQTASTNVFSRVDIATGANAQGAPGATRALLTINFDEDIDTDAFTPSVVASRGTQSLVFTPVQQLNPVVRSILYQAEVTPDLADGVYGITMSAQDLVGNRAVNVPVEEVVLRVDSTADQLIIRQQDISYIRSPVGNEAAEELRDTSDNLQYTIPQGVSFFELGPSDGLAAVAQFPGDIFTLSSGEIPTAIQVWADDVKESLLKTTFPSIINGEKVWLREDLKLANIDSPKVWVTGLDAAGNETDPVLIENVWLVGSTAANSRGISPHITSVGSRLVHPLDEALKRLRDLTSLMGIDEVVENAKAGYFWRSRSSVPFGPFPFSEDTMITYDSARDRLVLVVGLTQETQTWEWDGASWTNVTPAQNNLPGPRFDSGITYDSKRGRVIVFGGSDGNTTGSAPLATFDTWEWDGVSWIDVTAELNPQAREQHAMVYNSVEDKILVVGGAKFF